MGLDQSGPRSEAEKCFPPLVQINDPTLDMWASRWYINPYDKGGVCVEWVYVGDK